MVKGRSVTTDRHTRRSQLEDLGPLRFRIRKTTLNRRSGIHMLTDQYTIHTCKQHTIHTCKVNRLLVIT